MYFSAAKEIASPKALLLTLYLSGALISEAAGRDLLVQGFMQVNHLYHPGLRVPRLHHAGEKRHLVGVGRGLSRGWASSPGLGGAFAKLQRHKESACRVGEMVFAPSPAGEQVEMLAGMAEVLLNWF
jgi:hypothetical protein